MKKIHFSSISLCIMLGVAIFSILWSGLHPLDRWVWLFELSFGISGIFILLLIYPRFQFTPLVYYLVAVHFFILAVGAKYTYAEVPFFNWLKITFDLSRNHYDRVGHFAQGFFPAIIIREVLLRTTALKPGKMLFFLVTSVCLAFSAFYELCEWWIVLFFYPQSGPEWLGMQGDPWDAQWDMLSAFLGAMLSLGLFSHLHDRLFTKSSKVIGADRLNFL